ncbi:MAG: hypothetical protein ACKO0Z_15130 [Betaproteobacteria bacterium]
MITALWATVLSSVSMLGLSRLAHRKVPDVAPSIVRIEPDLVDPVEEVRPALPEAKAERPSGTKFVPLMEQKGPLRLVHPAKAADLFIKWLQQCKCTGVFAASEIDEFWDMACDELRLLPIPHGQIRIELQGISGVYVGRRSLGIEFIDIKRRTGKARATLYRIPDRAKAGASPPRPSHVCQPDALSEPWQDHVRGETSLKSRRVA